MFVKRSNRLVILVGVLLAVLAFVAVVVLLSQPAEVVPEEETRETVLVATRDIEIGESVTPDLVEEQLVPPEAVTQTPLVSASQVAGQPALFPIPAGSQVTAEAVGLTGTGAVIDLSARLSPGEKAIAFQVDRATGVDFLIKEGDIIDVILSQQISVLQETADSAANTEEDAVPRFETMEGLENQRTVKAVLQAKRVLYVSQTRARAPEQVDTDGDGVPDAEAEAPVIDSVIIVFAGTDQDAEVIKFAQNDLTELGSLTAVVRHADDEAIEETVGITIDQLVEDYGLRIPGIVELLTEESAP
jgi:Flp pilus assembly protein CpaB